MVATASARRRVAVLAAALVVVSAAVALWWAPGRREPEGAPAVAPAPRVASGRAWPPASPSGATPAAPAPATAEAPRPLEVQAKAMQRDCDLPLTTRCEAGGCVGLLRTPSLDRFDGWIHILAERPRFVLATALRDLGAGTDASPCGDAIGALLADHQALVVDQDGEQTWCVGSASDVGFPERCDRLAALGASAPRFSAPGARRLVFDR